MITSLITPLITNGMIILVNDISCSSHLFLWPHVCLLCLKIQDVKFQAQTAEEKEAWIKALSDGIHRAKNKVFDEVICMWWCQWLLPVSTPFAWPNSSWFHRWRLMKAATWSMSLDQGPKGTPTGAHQPGYTWRRFVCSSSLICFSPLPSTLLFWLDFILKTQTFWTCCSLQRKKQRPLGTVRQTCVTCSHFLLRSYQSRCILPWFTWFFCR